MSIPAVAVVGPSGNGKTTVASALVEILTGRGYRIAAVKHCPHGHDVDRPGSDTSRLFAAGAAQVMAVSPGLSTRFQRTTGDRRLEELLASPDLDCDLVIAEGFKASSAPKILVPGGGEPSSLPENVLAVVGERHGERAGVPHYRQDDMAALATLVEDEILRPAASETRVSLLLDGAPVPMKSFPARALAGVVFGFTNALRVAQNQARRVVLTIDVARSEATRTEPTRNTLSRASGSRDPGRTRTRRRTQQRG